MSTDRDVVERLRECANEAWPYAELVSNTGRPATDNNYGRAATVMREAADEIERLRSSPDRGAIVGECAAVALFVRANPPKSVGPHTDGWREAGAAIAREISALSSPPGRKG